mmetsp:Transcript_14783/g.33629  ORF Transcript_14783/g.33629 Transcript_14783/m.33629 type:complete len:426 (+) Transcript_14783:80-1357(+)
MAGGASLPDVMATATQARRGNGRRQRATNQAQVPLAPRRKSSRSEQAEDLSQFDMHPERSHPRKIFVGGLAHKTTTQHLREHFSSFGTIVDAVVLRWPDGRSRGFGYVTFAQAESAAVALGQAHQVGGRDVDVKRAVPGTNKLFVGGLPQNTTHVDLREHFEDYGIVSDAVVMIDPTTNRSRGFGFVCFLPGQDGAAAVASALEHYSNHYIKGKWIEVKSATPPHKLLGNGTDTDRPATRSTTPSGSEASSVSIPDLASFSKTTSEQTSPNFACGWRELAGPVKVHLPDSSLASTFAPEPFGSPTAYNGALPAEHTTTPLSVGLPPGLAPVSCRAEATGLSAAQWLTLASPLGNSGLPPDCNNPLLAGDALKRTLQQTLEQLLDFDAQLPMHEALLGKQKSHQSQVLERSTEDVTSRFAADVRGG